MVFIPVHCLQGQYVDSVTTSEQQPQVMIEDLDICQSYWVTITAINYCGDRSATDPMILGIKDTLPYELNLVLSDTITCSDWINQDTQAKIMDMEKALQGAGSSCGLSIPCFASSQWQCSTDDKAKLTFK